MCVRKHLVISEHRKYKIFLLNYIIIPHKIHGNIMILYPAKVDEAVATRVIDV